MKVSLLASTKIKVFSITIILILVPLLLYGKKSIDLVHEALLESNGDRFQEVAATTINAIDRLMYQRRQDLKAIAADPAVKNIIVSDMQGTVTTKFREWKKQYGVYSSFFAIDKDKGVIIASSELAHVGRSVVNEKWFETIRNAGSTYGSKWFAGHEDSTVFVSPVEYDSLSGSYGVNFSVAVKGLPNIVITSRLNWSELFEVINSVSVANAGDQSGAFAVLLDNQQRVIAGPGFLVAKESPADPGALLFDSSLIPVGAQIKSRLQVQPKQTGFLVQGFHNNEQYLTGYAPSLGYLDYLGFNWSVLVLQQVKDVMVPVADLLFYWKVLLVVFSVLGLVIVAMILSAIESQIGVYAHIVNSVKDGDYSKKAADGLADIGRLGIPLNEMVLAIRTRVLQLVTDKHNAEFANRNKGELMAHIGHELRSPLHGIIEIADVLWESSPTVEQRSCAKNIVRSATSLLSLAHNLVEIHLLEQGSAGTEPSAYNLDDVVQEVAEVLSLASAHRGVELITYFDPECPRNFIGHSAQVHQILTNLMEHAIKHTETSQVLMSVHGHTANDAEARVWVLVDDVGLGLKRGSVESIWKVGDEDSASLYEYKDVGLDLVMSKQIASLIGGSLGRVGGDVSGSEVSWFAISQLIDSDVQKDESLPYSLNGSKVLVAVHNQVTGKLLSLLLSSWNAEPVISTYGDDALSELRDAVNSKDPFDYLITSEQFTGDGTTFLSKIAVDSCFGNPKTVFLNSLTNMFDASSFGERLPLRVLHTPFSAEELQSAFRGFEPFVSQTEESDSRI